MADEAAGVAAGFQFLGIPPKGEPSFRTNDILPALKGGFQFLGIPPKGELVGVEGNGAVAVGGFQFLGIPPKGEPRSKSLTPLPLLEFPISRDPPEGGTWRGERDYNDIYSTFVSNF